MRGQPALSDQCSRSKVPHKDVNMSMTLDSIDIVGSDYFAQNGYPHEAWALLRREAPVYWYDRPGSLPFWAITKHADIVWISKQPELFLNAPRLAVFPEFEKEG